MNLRKEWGLLVSQWFRMFSIDYYHRKNGTRNGKKGDENSVLIVVSNMSTEWH